MHPQIRYDYFQNRAVVIAPRRDARPHEIKAKAKEIILARCNFCGKNALQEKVVDHMGELPKWDVLTLTNIYAALTPENPDAFGTQEVIIESPHHDRDLAEQPLEQIRKVIDMYIRRTNIVSKSKSTRYCCVFKNDGVQAGTSKQHPHSQIYSTGMLPPFVQEEQADLKKYRQQHKNCPYCDIIKKELRSKRLCWKDRNMLVIAPYASQYHYEAWIMSRRHVSGITQLNEGELDSLAAALKHILAKLHGLRLPYNFFLHEVKRSNDRHFYVKVQPRATIWGGIELSSGLIINSVSPEEAASFYKK